MVGVKMGVEGLGTTLCFFIGWSEFGGLNYAIGL